MTMAVYESLALLIFILTSVSLWIRLHYSKEDAKFWREMYVKESKHHNEQFNEWMDILNDVAKRIQSDNNVH